MFFCTYLIWWCFPKMTKEDLASGCVWICWLMGCHVTFCHKNSGTFQNQCAKEKQQCSIWKRNERNARSASWRDEHFQKGHQSREAVHNTDNYWDVYWDWYWQESLCPPWEFLDKYLDSALMGSWRGVLRSAGGRYSFISQCPYLK